MLRRSLLLFAACVLVGLAATVGFALLGLSGPRDALDDAERALEAGDYGSALRELSLAGRSATLQGDRGLRERMLELQLRAHRATGNHLRALEDVDRLLEIRPDDPDLLRRRIALLNRAGRPEEAIARATAFLQRWPDDGRGLELAGEARQLHYRDELVAVVETIRREVTGPPAVTADRALRDWLYRPAGDPRTTAGRARLLELLEEHAAGAIDTSFEPRLDTLRRDIQESLSSYRQALTAPGRPVSAYQSWWHALKEGGRNDDVLALSEIYLARFDHRYATRAAAHLARAHLEAGRPAATIEIARRFLPADGWRERFEQGRLDDSARHLMLDRMRAHLRVGDMDGAEATAGQVHAMNGAGCPLNPEVRLLLGLFHAEAGRLGRAAGHLDAWCHRAAGLPRDPHATDLYTLGMRRLLDVLREQSSPEAEEALQAHIESWVRQRSGEVEPRLARSRHRLRTGRAAGAFEDALTAMDRAVTPEEKERALLAIAAAADELYASSRQDGAGLLAQCLRLGTQVPEVPHSIGYLLVAREAMDRDELPIAFASSERAVQNHLWARAPRLLHARAALALDRPEDAAATLESGRSFHPGDPEMLVLLHSARRHAGMGVDDLVLDLVRYGEPTPEVLALLLETTLEKGPRSALAGLVRRAAALGSPSAELLPAQVQACIELGDALGAQRAYARLRALGAPAERVLPATAAVLAMRAPELTEGAVSAAIGEILPLAHLVPETAFGLAEDIADSGHHRPALRLVEAVLTQTEADERTGERHATAARLAMVAGELDRARRHARAAVTFPTGSTAVLPLAALLAQEDSIDDARTTVAFAPPGTEVPPALLLRLGRHQQAEQGLAAAGGNRPDALRDLVLRTLLGSPPPDWPELADLVDAERDRLLDALAFLALPDGAAAAVSITGELLDDHPGHPVVTLLHARALVEGGRFQEAGALLAERVEAGEGRWPLVLTAARLAARHGDPRVVLAPALQTMVTAGAESPRGPVTPELEVAAGRLLAVQKARNEGPAAALDVMVDAWRRHPVVSGARLADVRTLYAAGRVDDAVAVLEALEPHLEPEQRGAFLELWFHGATILSLSGEEDGARWRAAARTRAREIIDGEGAFGPAVQFLVREAEDRLGPLRDDGSSGFRQRRDRQLRWAQGILEMAASGREQSPGAVRFALAVVRRFTGTEAALERTEELLREVPGWATVWELRSRLLEDRGRRREAVAELRALHGFLPDAQLAVTRTMLATMAGIDDESDRQALREAVASEHWDDPATLLPRAMLALRSARYQEAETLFRSARPSNDGAHLFYRALANLGIAGPESHERARALFAELAREHPDSPLAANAGNFAEQLALR